MKEHRDGRFAEEAVTLMTVATVCRPTICLFLKGMGRTGALRRETDATGV